MLILIAEIISILKHLNFYNKYKMFFFYKFQLIEKLDRLDENHFPLSHLLSSGLDITFSLQLRCRDFRSIFVFGESFGAEAGEGNNNNNKMFEMADHRIHYSGRLFFPHYESVRLFFYFIFLFFFRRDCGFIVLSVRKKLRGGKNNKIKKNTKNDIRLGFGDPWTVKWSERAGA